MALFYFRTSLSVDILTTDPSPSSPWSLPHFNKIIHSEKLPKYDRCKLHKTTLYCWQTELYELSFTASFRIHCVNNYCVRWNPTCLCVLRVTTQTMFTVPFGTTWFILASRLSQPRNKVRFVHTDRKRMGSTLNTMRIFRMKMCCFFPVPHSLSISVHKTLNVFWTAHSTELRQNYTIWRSHWPTTTLRPLSVSMGLHGTQSRLEQGYFFNQNHWRQCSKVRIPKTSAYNEQFLSHLQDPVYTECQH